MQSECIYVKNCDIFIFYTYGECTYLYLPGIIFKFQFCKGLLYSYVERNIVNKFIHINKSFA